MLFLLSIAGVLDPVPSVAGFEAGYTLDRVPVYHRDDIQRQTTTHTCSQIRLTNYPNCKCLGVGGSQSTRGKPTQTQQTCVLLALTLKY